MHFDDLESCYFNLRHGRISCKYTPVNFSAQRVIYLAHFSCIGSLWEKSGAYTIVNKIQGDTAMNGVSYFFPLFSLFCCEIAYCKSSNKYPLR